MKNQKNKFFVMEVTNSLYNENILSKSILPFNSKVCKVISNYKIDLQKIALSLKAVA